MGPALLGFLKLGTNTKTVQCWRSPILTHPTLRNPQKKVPTIHYATPDSMLMPKLDVQTTSYGLFGRTFTFRKRASFKYNHLSITFPEYETPPRNLFVWNLNISGCLILEGWDYKHVYIYTYIYMYIYIYIYIYTAMSQNPGTTGTQK